MTEVSEKPASKTPPGVGNAAPDWRLVPFEVGCARCGQDLRGLSDPRCSACGLEFEWAQALPLEELQCPGCDYHLMGLTDARCPECGRPFTWDGVLSAAHRRRTPLFEYHWRDHPISSLVRTWVRAMRPRRFWSEINLHDRPRAPALLTMVAITLAGLIGSILLINALSFWIQRRPWLGGSTSSQLFECLQLAFVRESGSRSGLLLSVWSAASLVALFVFRWSMRRVRIQRTQVVRVWAYAISPTLLVFVILGWLSLVREATIPYFGPGVGPLTHPRNFPFGGALMVGLMTWCLSQGYKQYLRMPHAVAVAIASQAIAVLGALILWHFLFGGQPEYLIYSLMRPILGQSWLHVR